MEWAKLCDVSNNSNAVAKTPVAKPHKISKEWLAKLDPGAETVPNRHKISP